MTWVSTAELARTLMVSTRTLYRYVRRGMPGPTTFTKGAPSQWPFEDVIEWAVAHDIYDAVVDVADPVRPGHMRWIALDGRLSTADVAQELEMSTDAFRQWHVRHPAAPWPTKTGRRYRWSDDDIERFRQWLDAYKASRR